MAKVNKELTTAVQKAFAALGKNSVVGDVERYLPAFVRTAPYIKVDPRPLEKRGNPFDKSVLTPTVAWKVASLVSWLFLHRPVGDAVRAGIPKVVAALRAVLADKRNIWVLESKYWDEESAAKRRRRHEAMAELVGGKVVKPTKSKGAWLEGRDDGTLVLAPSAPDANGEAASVFGGFYTAKLDDSSLSRIVAFANAISDWPESDTIPPARHIQSDGFAAMGARVTTTPVPMGGWEANPANSAPELVVQVAAAHGLSNDGAALLLQTLALPEPTKASVLLWNGWSSSQYDAAADELVKSKLAVSASVAGAGRRLFAPGAVIKKTKLNLPLERSKLPFITHGQHVKHLITRPCHELFAQVAAQW